MMKKKEKQMVNLTEEDLLSKTIATVRFPMAFLVVMIHGYFSTVIVNGGKTVIDFSNYDVFRKITLLIGEIASVAVPVFYILSGFLFFYKISEFNKKCYFSKLYKRANTLLIPYLFWNLFATFFFMLGQICVPEVFSGNRSSIINYSWWEILLLFWNNAGTGFPASSQLWFLRDLMIVVIVSPLIYLFVKYAKVWGVLLLWVLWVFDIEPNITGLNITSFFLFSLGAYFSIHKVNFVNLSTGLFEKGVGYIYLVILILALVLENTSYSPYLHKFSISIGIFFVFGVTAWYLSKGGRESSFLSKSSMFIYLLHVTPIIFLKKIVIMIVQPDTELKAILVYFLCPLIMTVICLCLFWVLRKYLNKFTSIITGGRV
jgi:surface polysaccharide O-acyltransferase-like enzyme